MLGDSLSGTWISRGSGMVGQLSFRSMIRMVKVAEPESLGLPRSVAVITNLMIKKTHRGLKVRGTLGLSLVLRVWIMFRVRIEAAVDFRFGI